VSPPRLAEAITPRRRRATAVLAALALAAAPATAAAVAAPTLLDPAPGCGPALDAAEPLDCQPPVLASYGGWLAWSRAAGERSFQLELRSPAGDVSAAPVAPRGSPFDVELGPQAGGIVAVYSRCTDPVSYRGCSLYELQLGAAGTSERPLRPPGGGSLHEPAIWNGSLVFLRRSSGGGSENPLHRMGRRPDALFSWHLGSRRVQALTLPSSLGTREWPRGLTGVLSGLTIRGSWIAYVTSSGFATSALELGMRTLWAQVLGGGPRLVDQLTAGEGNVCDPTLISPALTAGWVYAYSHPCDPSGRDLDRWTRYSLTSHAAERARLNVTSSAEDQIYDVVPDRSGAAWEGSEVLDVPSVSWRPVSRPVPASFCSRSDLFC
jgi:hypothetical protein